MSHNYRGIINEDIITRQRDILPYCFWNNVFNDEELDAISKLMSETQTVDAEISAKAPDGDAKIGAIDKNSRTSHVNFYGVNEKTHWIFDRLNQIIDRLNFRFYNFDLNGYSFFQYTEYFGHELGKYDWHMDSYLGSHPNGFTETRKLSITLLLNEPGVDFEGGDFQINKGSPTEVDTVDLKKGMLIAFPSFLIHRVAPVTKGTRKSIVIWVQGPKFR
jgi:PKHD-type hydroxylase